MPKNETKTCQQPDRDCPPIICGHPLPCPHHTLVIDATKHPAVISGAEGLPPSVRQKIQQIADAMGSDKQLDDWSKVPDDDLNKAHRQLVGSFCELNDDGHRYLREINAEQRRRQFQATTPLGRGIRKLIEGVSQKLTWLMLEGGIDFIRIRRTDDKLAGVIVTFVVGRHFPDSEDPLGGKIELRALEIMHAPDPETFGDLVLRLIKERDRAQKAVAFAMCTIRSGEAMTPEAEKIFADALGHYDPMAISTQLGLLTDKPDDLVTGARILARALDRTVYLTRMVTHGGVIAGSGTWTITIEHDRYGSHVAIEPDGSAKACEVLT
jgi:hypothetical protein